MPPPGPHLVDLRALRPSVLTLNNGYKHRRCAASCALYINERFTYLRLHCPNSVDSRQILDPVNGSPNVVLVVVVVVLGVGVIRYAIC